MPTDDKAAPPELFPHLREQLRELVPLSSRGREPTGVPSDCAQPAAAANYRTPLTGAEALAAPQLAPLYFDELVALLKARGFISEPEPAERPNDATIQEAFAKASHARGLEAKVSELEASLRLARAQVGMLNKATDVLGAEQETLSKQFEAERTLAAELGRQVDVLRLDAGNAARARADERQGFEAQIEQLQRHKEELRTELEAARAQILVRDERLGAAKATLDRVRSDAEGNVAEAERVQEQHAGQIQRQRDLINTLQDELQAAFDARDTFEEEKAEQIKNQVTAIQALMHEKAELARALDFEVTNRSPAQIGDALAKLAKPGTWTGLRPASLGRGRYLTNAFDRAVEANMWFVKATTKDEG